MLPANSVLPANPVHPRLPFTACDLLAPMEGVTEPCFRDLVLERNAATRLGGAFTEFARVTDVPLPRRVLRAHLGTRLFPQPVGLQLLGAHADALAESARRAFEVGAPLVDLNFGCPAKGALRGCAGSALLDDPPAIERLVSAVVRAAEGRVVTGKIRAGGEDDGRVEELVRAVESGGADLVTVHCRTRREGYRDTADWERLRRAVRAVAIPVCGNGGVREHADLARLRAETGCRFAMTGRAALGDPWIFSGLRVSRAQAAGFLVRYADELVARRGAPVSMAAGRVKQLLGHWTAGALLGSGADVEEQRRAYLRERDPQRLLERLRTLAAPGSPSAACHGWAPRVS